MKWIVIDFGTRKIKLLNLLQDGQKLSIVGHHSIKTQSDYYKGLGFPEPNAWAAVTIALNELDWLKAEEDHVVLAALPSAYLESRYLRFPFRNEKKIEKVLNFELESTIPFDIDEIQIRSQVLEGEGLSDLKKESLVLALAYKRSAIKQLEGELKKFQLSNPSLTVENLALSTLRQAITETPVFGLFTVGHSKSEFVLMAKNGSILGVKTFWWGGKSLIQACQEEFSVDEEKAFHILSHIDPEKPPTKSMIASVKNLVTEMRQTFKGMHSSGISFPKPLKVFAFGKPTKNKPLMKQIEEMLKSELEIKIEAFPYPNLKSRNLQGLETIRGDLESFLPAIGIALSQSRTHRPKIPSFSETGFQFQQNLKKLKTGSFSLLRKVALLMIAPVVYAFLQFFAQKQENEILLATLPALLRGSGFEIEKGESTDGLVARIKKEVSENQKKISQLEENEKSPLVVLTKLSSEIPSSLKIDIKELRVSPTSIFIAAETKSNETTDKILDSLRKRYPQLKASNPTNCAAGNKAECKSFTVEIDRSKSL